MSDKRSFASAFSALIGVLSRASNQIAALGVVVVAARFLGPSDFGVFAIASAFVTFVRATLYSGAYEYLLKTTDPADAAECLVVNAGLAIALTLCLLLLSTIAGGVFGSPAVGWLLAVMAPSNLISAFVAWQEAQVLRRNQIRAYYGMTTSVEIVSAIVAIALLLLGAGLGALAAQIYTRATLSAVGYVFVLRTGISLSIRPDVVRKIAKWSFSRYGSVSVTYVYQYAADILLGAFLAPAAAGLYRAASRIVTAVSDLFAQPAGLFGTTLFSARAASGRLSGDLWPQLLTASAFIGWSVLAGLGAASKAFVLVFLGPQWAAAAAIMPIFCIARAAQILVSVTIPLLVAYDRNTPILIVQSAASVLLIAALCVTAPFGVEAAALTVTVLSLMTTTAYMGLAVQLHPGAQRSLLQNLPLVLLPVAGTAAASALAQKLLSGWGMAGISVVLLTTIAGALVWGGFLLLFRSRIAQVFAVLNA